MSENAPQAKGKCFVLGFDRTESSRRAASWAAKQLLPDGKLVIVHACRPLHAPPSPLASERERGELGRAIIDELLLEDDGTLFDIDIATEVSDQDPVSALLDAVRRHDAEAIVVGCDRHSRLHKALGTVTGELHGVSHVPIIAVPAAAPAGAAAAETQA